MVAASITFLERLVDGSDHGFTITSSDQVPAGTLLDNSEWAARDVDIRSLCSPLPELGLTGDIHRDGFVLVDDPTAVEAWTEDEITSVYYAETVALIKSVVGADKRVHVFDHTLRTRPVDEAGNKVTEPGLSGTPAMRQPVLRAHNDYTPLSGTQRVRDLMGSEAEDLLSGRFAVVQVWRPRYRPVQDAPLTLCDARSVDPAVDLMPHRLIYPHRTGHTCMLRHSPRQRWFYAPAMQPNEAYVFKTYDSLDDGTITRYAPHTAFDDPTAPPDAPPRESIEVRALVFWPKPAVRDGAVGSEAA